MSADYASLGDRGILYLLTHNKLSDGDEVELVDRIHGAIARGDLPADKFHEPITQAQIGAVLSDPTVSLNNKFKIDQIIRDAGTVGKLPSLDAGVPAAAASVGIITPEMVDWVARTITTAIHTITSDPTVSEELRKWNIASVNELKSALFNAGMDALETAVTIVGDAVVAATPVAAKLAGQTMNQILGAGVDAERLSAAFAAPPNRENLVAIGEEFQKVVSEMFPLDFSRDNVLDRSKRDWSQNNLAAFMGTNMAFQLRSLTIGTVASFVPEFNLEHLEGLHQSINWAYGFGFLSWTVISAVMNVTTTKPLTEYYNSQVKGNDLTEGDALKAYVEKKIPLAQLNYTLDNLGVRDDIRDHKIDMARKGLTVSEAVKAYIQGHIDQDKFTKVMDREAERDDERQIKIDITRPDISEGDLIDLYQRGEQHESDLTAYFKEKGFEEKDVKLKVETVKKNRFWKLQEALATRYNRAFVRELVSEDEYTQYLKSLTYTDEEIAIEIKRAEIIRKEEKIFHLTVGEIIAQVTRGAWSATQGLTRLVEMGWDRQDASDLLSLAILDHYVSRVPKKVKDAYEEEHPWLNNLQASLQVVLELDPTYPLRAKDYMIQVLRLIELAKAG